jgi:hypothetical protein
MATDLAVRQPALLPGSLLKVPFLQVCPDQLRDSQGVPDNTAVFQPKPLRKKQSEGGKVKLLAIVKYHDIGRGQQLQPLAN